MANIESIPALRKKENRRRNVKLQNTKGEKNKLIFTFRIFFSAFNCVSNEIAGVETTYTSS